MPFRLLSCRMASPSGSCATASRSNAPAWTCAAKSVRYAALRNVMPSAWSLASPAARTVSAFTAPRASCSRRQIVSCAFVRESARPIDVMNDRRKRIRIPPPARSSRRGRSPPPAAGPSAADKPSPSPHTQNTPASPPVFHLVTSIITQSTQKLNR